MLELSRLRLGELKLQLQKFNLHNCVTEFLEPFQQEAKVKKLSVRMQMSPSELQDA